MPSPSHEFLDSRETDRLPTGEFPSCFPEDFVRGLDTKTTSQVVILWRRRLFLRFLPLDHLVTLLHFSIVPGTEKIHSPSASVRAGLPGPCAAGDLLLATGCGWLGQPAGHQWAPAAHCPGDVGWGLLMEKLSEAGFGPPASPACQQKTQKHRCCSVCLSGPEWSGWSPVPGRTRVHVRPCERLHHQVPSPPLGRGKSGAGRTRSRSPFQRQRAADSRTSPPLRPLPRVYVRLSPSVFSLQENVYCAVMKGQCNVKSIKRTPGTD